MSVSSRVVGGDLRGLKELERRIRAGRPPGRELVGIPAGKTEADGTSLAQVGAWVEFGTETAPERPFMRKGIRSGIADLRRVASDGLKQVADGNMTMETVLGLMGAVGVGAIQKYMTGDNFVPNAPFTIAKKGSAQPTIDSGQLRQGITHVPESAA